MERAAHPTQTLESRIDLVDLVFRTATYLEEDGPVYRGTCPFHHVRENESSTFTVSPSENRFACSSCKVHGGSLDFIRNWRNISSDEAFDLLRTMYSLPVPLSTQKQEREPLYALNAQAADLFQKHLLKDTSSSSPFAYLRERGLSEKTIISNRLGWAPDSWDFLLNSLRKGNYSPELMEKAGLVTKKVDGGHYYDFFRGRIMFPLIDITGRAIGFSARAFFENDKPKYLNSPTTLIFEKDKFIYGLHQASREIRDAGERIVVEGQMDVLLAHQHGQKNVVGALTSSITEHQVALLRQRFRGRTWNICFDGDSAGRGASLRTATKLLGKFNANIALLPEGKDPTDLYTQGDSLAPYLKKSVPLFDHYFETKRAGRTLTQVGELEEFLKDKDLYHEIMNIPYQSRGLYIDEISKRLNRTYEAVEPFFTPPQKRGVKPRELWETTFIKQLMASGPQPEMMIYFSEVCGFKPEDLSLPETRALYSYCLQNIHQSSDLPLTGTPLFGLPKFFRYAQTQNILLDSEKVEELLNTSSLYVQKPALRDLEYSVNAINAYSVGPRYIRAYERGVPFLELNEHARSIPGGSL